MKQAIVVFGGSGFVGQGICQEAIKRRLPVISISRHGKPRKEQPWMSHPLITWVQADIFNEDTWSGYLDNSLGCINLIGILFENKRKGLTYQRLIVDANHVIANACERAQIPYLFISAKTGPCGYLAAKKQAEHDLFQLTNPIIIIRPGLVVTKQKPLKWLQGVGIKCASHLPLVNHLADDAYPVPLQRLAADSINYLQRGTSTIVADIK